MDSSPPPSKAEITSPLKNIILITAIMVEENRMIIEEKQEAKVKNIVVLETSDGVP